MNKSVVAGVALIAGIAIAAPMLARSADNPPAAEQSAPIIPPSGQGLPAGRMPGNGMMGQGMMGHPGLGMMGQHGPLRAMMMRRMMMRRSPQQRCEEHVARRAGMIAYTVTRLNLTAEQRPLWDKLNAIIQAGTAKQQQLCAAMKPHQAGGPTILDRVGWLEQTLSARAESLHETRPALEQLYQMLTPEQKAIIDHPFARR